MKNYNVLYEGKFGGFTSRIRADSAQGAAEQFYHSICGNEPYQVVRRIKPHTYRNFKYRVGYQGEMLALNSAVKVTFHSQEREGS